MSQSEGDGKEAPGDELPKEDSINPPTQGMENCEVIISHAICHSLVWD